MAVSPSTVVLGLLTCIPFGLAIRDTANGKTGPDYGEHDLDEPEDERAERMRRYEEEEELREQSAKAELAHDAAIDAVLGELFGAEPASLSERFVQRLGQQATGTDSFTDEATFESEHDVRIQADNVGTLLNGVKIEPVMGGSQTRALCNRMGEYLEEKWGPPSAGQSIWLAADGHQRAVLLHLGEDCVMFVERAATIDQWINKGTSSIVPVWAIGQPVKKLAEAIHAEVPQGATLEWQGPGIGASTGKTQLTAYIKRGKVVGIVASSPRTMDSQEIDDHFVELFGEPTQWTKPPIELVYDNETRVTVAIGKTE